MPEKVVPITFPFKGLSDNVAFGEQPDGTCREAQNVRGIDPVSGRIKGGQRAGLSKYNDNKIVTGSKVADLNFVTLDDRNITYGNLAGGSEVQVWSAASPTNNDVFVTRTDRQSNVYILDDGNRITKYNKDGEELLSIAIPVDDDANRCKVLWIDDFDGIYTAVTSNGDQSKSKILKFLPRPDNKFELAWEFTVGWYVVGLKVVEDKLYTVQNDIPNKASRIVAYDALFSLVPPLVSWEQGDNLAWPVNGMDVNKAGDVYCASLQAFNGGTFRGRSSSDKEQQPTVVDQDPRELVENQLGASAAEQLWAWYRADEIRGFDLVGGALEEGAELLIWRDVSGNQRHLVPDIANGDKGPTYTSSAVGRRPAVVFNGTDTSLISGLNMGALRDNRDLQKTLLPGYTDCIWHLYIVFTPTQEDAIGCVMQQDNSAATGGSEWSLWANRNEQDAIPGASATTSEISVYDDTTASADPATGTGDQPVSFTVDEAFQGTQVIHYTFNNDLTPVTTCNSQFRHNGEVVEADYHSDDFETDVGPTYIGKHPTGAGANYYRGTISEIYVFRGDGDTEDEPLFDTGTEGSFASIGEDLEGYAGLKYGLYLGFPDSGFFNPHPYGLDASNNVGPPPDGVSSPHSQILRPNPLLVKYGANNGEVKWVANQNTPAGQTSAGGYGHSVVVTDNDIVYSYGTNYLPLAVTTPSGTTDLRRIVDDGDTASVASPGYEVDTGVLSTPVNALGTDVTPRTLDFDEFDNVYVPFVAGAVAVRAYDDTGTSILSLSITGSPDAHSVTVDDDIPEYDTDLTNDIAENIFVGTAGTTNIYRYELVEVTSETGSPRTQKVTAVSSGTIKTVVSGATSPTTPTGGASALDSTAQYIQSAVLFQKVYFTDGKSYKVYDGPEDEVVDWESTSAGQIPARRKLVEAWRDRMMLARGPDDPHIWDASEFGNANGWDFFPPVPNERQAISGVITAGPGPCPDIINSMCPYTDDILIFGGDHTLYALVGDPAAGGRFDLVSDITGMAFGRPWAKDPNGILYFVGSRGGLYRMVPGGKPERLSLHRIERRMQDIDLSTNYVRLFYNYRDEGVHILQMPFGAGGTSLTHWFFEIKTESFWEDKFGNTTITDVQPTAGIVIDGDDVGDRILLLGGEDGFVRKWDESSKNDDTRSDGSTKVPIDALVTIGPLGPTFEGYETQFSGLTVVLGETEEGARWEYFAAETPDKIGSVRRTGSLDPGRNAPRWDRVTGPYCWVRLRNTGVDERFSYERGFMHATPAGLVRPGSS